MKQIPVYRLFMISGLAFLIAGSILGLLGALQYVLPSFLLLEFPFSKTRPLHVLLVISCIFSMAWSGIYYFLSGDRKQAVKGTWLAYGHWILMTATVLICAMLYSGGVYGGREYLEFPPVMGLPILLYAFMYFFWLYKNLKVGKNAPVYHWMWFTGSVFFIFTFIESQLWQIPFFRDNAIRDMTVQWKALGSMVGSWNMLVYGIAFCLMEKISGNERPARSVTAFCFYFLGLTNLMFNWGHHTYIIPASPWIRQISFLISMTELILLWNIIRNWKNSLSDARKHFHKSPYRFLLAADVWILLNLILAILISIPALNSYTHGTHITVAHAMGATIGINIMILFSLAVYQTSSDVNKRPVIPAKKLHFGFWSLNVFLLLFWICLLSLGWNKLSSVDTFHQMFMIQNGALFSFLFVSGAGLAIAISGLVVTLLRFQLKNTADNPEKELKLFNA